MKTLSSSALRAGRPINVQSLIFIPTNTYDTDFLHGGYIATKIRHSLGQNFFSPRHKSNNGNTWFFISPRILYFFREKKKSAEINSAGDELSKLCELQKKIPWKVADSRPRCQNDGGAIIPLLLWWWWRLSSGSADYLSGHPGMCPWRLRDAIPPLPLFHYYFLFAIFLELGWKVS